MILQLTLIEFLKIIPKDISVGELLIYVRSWKKEHPNDFELEVVN